MADYGKGALTAAVIESITAACQASGSGSWSRPSEDRISAYTRRGALQVESREAVELADREGTFRQPWRAGLLSRRGCAAPSGQRRAFGAVVVTMGADGCLFHDAAGLGMSRRRRPRSTP